MSAKRLTRSSLHGEDGSERKPIKVAIIGSGLAGLCAAYLLSQTEDLRKRFEVHIFEKNESLGLDSSSITISSTNGKQGSKRVDVPMRSFNIGYYPNLTRLYTRLGLKLERKNFTFSFASLHSPRSPFLLYNGQSGLRGFSVKHAEDDSQKSQSNSLKERITTTFIQSQTTIFIAFSYLVLLFFALYHHACGHLLDPKHSLSQEPFLHWTKRHKRILSPIFVHSILFTLFSAVTTSSIAAVEQIPASEILLYISSTFLRDHFVLQEGVQIVQDALIRNINEANIHTSCTVEKINKGTNQQNQYEISTKSHEQWTGFDHIILATPATLSNALLNSLRTSSQDLKQSDEVFEEQDQRICMIQDTLTQIRYEESTVINHQDASLLPISNKDWRDLNLLTANVTRKDDRSSDFIVDTKHRGRSAMATHIIQSDKKVGNKKSQLILQTTNPTIWPKEDLILSSSKFLRALTPTSKQAIEGLFIWQPKQLSLFGRISQFISIFAHQPSPNSPSSNFAIQSDWLTSFFSIFTGKKHVLKLGKLQIGQDFHREHHGKIWLCGSYAQGIPLLEGCVTSSTLIVGEIIKTSIV